MKDTFYFQHDYNARNDPKIQRLLMDLGVSGLGVYWCVVEMLYEQGGYLPLTDYKSIAFALHVDEKDVQCVINNYDLFQNDGDLFWSRSAIDRLTKRKDIVEKRKAAAVARWDKSKDKTEPAPAPAPAPSSEEPGIDYDLIVAKFNSTCVSLPKVQKLTAGRKNKVKSRIREMKGDIGTLETVFAKMQASDFCCGRGNSKWKATFDWLFDNDKNWVKVLEGNYDNGKMNNHNVNDIWK